LHFDPKTYRILARYSLAVNTKIYDALKDVADSIRKEARGGFFPSIHSILNHLLWADLRWLNELTEVDAVVPPIGQEIHFNFETLRDDHLSKSNDIIALVDEATDVWLRQTILWQSAVGQDTKVVTKGLCLMHLFNQQTYHRGQMSTYMTQAGIDIGSTDLIAVAS